MGFRPQQLGHLGVELRYPAVGHAQVGRRKQQPLPGDIIGQGGVLQLADVQPSRAALEFPKDFVGVDEADGECQPGWRNFT